MLLLELDMALMQTYYFLLLVIHFYHFNLERTTIKGIGIEKI